jgi:glycosyltransferase involved in cell wall biosynthesis
MSSLSMQPEIQALTPERAQGPRMHVCMVSYSIYDTDNRVRRYAETLAREGHRVDAVVLRAEGQSNQPEVIKGVNVFRIQKRIKNEKGKLDYLRRMSAFFLRSMVFLTREQLRNPYDLIHVHSLPDFEVFAALVPKLMGAKIILDIHDIVPEFYASKFNTSQDSFAFKTLVAVERISASFCDHVIAANHIWEKRLQSRSVKAAKVTTILNFPDTEMFQRKGRNRLDNRFVLLYPGSLNYHQGLDIAIRAFDSIKELVPHADFHIYGTGEALPRLKEMVVELGLGDRVLIKGALSIDKISAVIENADLGIVPKRKDGFGNEAFSTKILEFMSLGLPAIIPDTMVDRYYFNDSVAKFFIANDEGSLAAAMLELITHSEIREHLVRNASEFVKSYTWGVNQSTYLELIEGLTEKRVAAKAGAQAAR